MTLIGLLKDEITTSILHGYCKTAPNHHSLTLNAICMYVHLSLSLDIIYYPTSEQHEVLLFGSIQEGLLQARQNILQTEKKNTKN